MNCRKPHSFTQPQLCSNTEKYPSLAAIEKVASAQGFDYVLDSSAGGSVIMSKGTDLMADVKTELGF